MEINQIGYVLVDKQTDKLFKTDIKTYASNVKINSEIFMTNDIQKCEIFRSYEEAEPLAIKYDLKIKKIKTIFI